MKTLIFLISAVLFLNTTNVKSGPAELAKQKQNVRNQVNYSLATSSIEEKGTVTIYFYVLNRNVKIHKIEGSNEVLNQKVKSRLEETGVTQKNLNGYYMVTIKLNGSSDTAFSSEEKNRLRELMATNYVALRGMNIAE